VRALAEAAVDRRRAAAPGGPPDLLDRLLAARTPEGTAMGRSQVVANLIFCLIAGFESTAAALSWAAWLLAVHPACQERLRAEALTATPEAGATGAGLSWTTAVLLETMRLYPPVPVLVRQARTGDRLGRRRVHAGDTVFLPVYALHRQAAHWPEPDRFRPDRFLGHCPRAGPAQPYLPFAAGPRTCPGAALSLAEMRIILTSLLRRVRLSVPPGARPPRPRAILVLKTGGGVRLRAERL
jgi:Cytochrome P450